MESVSKRRDVVMGKIDLAGILAKAQKIAGMYDSRDYLNFVRRNPCIVCGRLAKPHRLKEGGVARDALMNVPLCPEDFKEISRMGIDAFAQQYKLDIETIILDMVGDYFGGDC